MDAILFFLGGVIVGVLGTIVFFNRRRPSGTFYINLDDPMDETLRLEMDDNLNRICSKKRISLAVIVTNSNSLN